MAGLSLKQFPRPVPENRCCALAELEKYAPQDAILSTNSSNYKSSEMLVKVGREQGSESWTRITW
jgi:hypothetical protein